MSLQSFASRGEPLFVTHGRNGVNLVAEEEGDLPDGSVPDLQRLHVVEQPGERHRPA
jgi:hypothetical protein